MTAPKMNGTNLRRLKKHLREHEKMADRDIGQIVSDARAVFERCLPLGATGLKKGLIYGNIQSGKTAVILGLIAIAADNGHQHFIVLTSDLVDLYDQTLDRVKNSLHGLSVLGKQDMKHAAPAAAGAPSVLVVSKNVTVLKRAAGAAVGWSGNSVMIIDDEADQASLDTMINRPDKGPSGVNREVAALRGMFSLLSFVQTTATPQALLLQDANSPFRPDFVHVTTPGHQYCGGDVFFVKEDFAQPRYLRFIDNLDVLTLRSQGVLPRSLQEALCAFFVAAAMLRLKGSSKNYQALVHTSLKRDEHQLVTDLVDAFTRQVGTAVALAVSGAASADPGILAAIRQARRDFVGRSTGAGAPTVAKVLREIGAGILSCTVVQTNSRSGEGVQANPNRRHIIYIGGTKLGRGVTIKNLLTTYYVRDAKNPQIDTVLQHARMYGYRRDELPYTRIYVPRHLAERFRQIHITDESMKELAKSTGNVIPVIPIPIQSLRATRANVLSQQSVELTTYIGGRQYYPLVPVSSGAALVKQTSELDRRLGALCPTERQPIDTTIRELESLLGFTFGQPGAPGAWDDELVRHAVGLLARDSRYGDKAQVIVGSRASDVGKLATRGAIPQIQALLPANAGNPAYQSRADVPVLVFMRLRGAVEKSWDGVPFWVPNMRFPDGNYAFSLNRS